MAATKETERSEPLNDQVYYGGMAQTNDALLKQDRIPVFVPQPHGSQPQYTKFLPVGINGVWWFIRYGKLCAVPVDVYKQLVGGISNWVDGEPQPFVQPMHEDDVQLMPRNKAQDMLYKNIAEELNQYHATGQMPTRRHANALD